MFRVSHEAQRQAARLDDLMPEEVLPILLSAQLLDDLGRHQEALEAYDRAIAKRPGSADARVRKAESHLAHGESSEGIALLEAVLQNGALRASERAAVTLRLAGAYWAGDRPAAAADMFRVAGQYPSTAGIAHNDLAWLLATHAPDTDDAPDFEKALAHAQHAVSLEPENPHFLDTLGWIRVLMGDADEAIAPLERAAKAMPGLAAIRYHLGKAYLETGQTEKGVRELKQALAIGQVFEDMEEARMLVEGRAPEAD
jgi:tetratricopeptide (TPR) repeat protein